MSSGAFPACDWNGHLFDADSPAGKKAGTALAGGYIAPLVALQGDLEYFYAKVECCFWLLQLMPSWRLWGYILQSL